MKFFTDEHIAKAIVDQLRKRNIDVVQCEEAGLKNAVALSYFYKNREAIRLYQAETNSY